jgi:protein archease
VSGGRETGAGRSGEYEAGHATKRMYRWNEHTSELELEIRAPSERQVLAEALAAVGELLSEEASQADPGSVATRRVLVEGDDRAALLADWLSELAFLAEVEGIVPERTVELRLAPGRLEATVEGRRGRPRHLVKAVTYHGLRFEPNGDGWRATAVLDV